MIEMIPSSACRPLLLGHATRATGGPTDEVEYVNNLLFDVNSRDEQDTVSRAIALCDILNTLGQNFSFKLQLDIALI